MKELDEAVSSREPVLVDFYAKWCAPCQWLEPILEEVGEKVKGRAHILKVDVDEHPAVAEKLNIRSVPTLIIFKEGRICWRMPGFLLRDELVEKIEEFI
jgi:thioredoxin 1